MATAPAGEPLASVRPGEIVGLVGPSGCGKTRALRSAFRDWRAHHGESWPAAAFLGQNPATQSLADTAREEIVFALEAAGIDAAEIARRLDRVLDAFSLRSLAEARMSQLSMGERCRVLIASISVLEAPAIFLDEPFAQLDGPNSTALRAAIGCWAGRGRAVVVTHQDDHPFAGLCHRVEAMPHAAGGLSPFSADALPAPSAPVSGDAIVVEGLELSVGGSPLLEDISLHVPAGTLAVIAGANGAGKSSLLRALAGAVPVEAGTRSIAGLANPGSGDLAGRVGLALQDPDLQLSGATVRDEIAARATSPRTADALMAFAGLEALRDRSTLRLSFGQKQVVAFAVALAHRPALLHLDEPFCGLDRETAVALSRALAAACERTGLAVLAVTHDPASALALAGHRLWHLEHGRLR